MTCEAAYRSDLQCKVLMVDEVYTMDWMQLLPILSKNKPSELIVYGDPNQIGVTIMTRTGG